MIHKHPDIPVSRSSIHSHTASCRANTITLFSHTPNANMSSDPSTKGVTIQDTRSRTLTTHPPNVPMATNANTNANTSAPSSSVGKSIVLDKNTAIFFASSITLASTASLLCVWYHELDEQPYGDHLMKLSVAFDVLGLAHLWCFKHTQMASISFWLDVAVGVTGYYLQFSQKHTVAAIIGLQILYIVCRLMYGPAQMPAKGRARRA